MKRIFGAAVTLALLLSLAVPTVAFAAGDCPDCPEVPQYQLQWRGGV